MIAKLRKILHPYQSIQESEGKYLTLSVLVVDIIGFTKFTLEYGVEKSLTLLKTFIPACMGAVEKYGGFTEKNTGDGILAYFGLTNYHTKSDQEVCSSVRQSLASVTEMEQKVLPKVNGKLRSRTSSEKITFKSVIDVGIMSIARIGTIRSSHLVGVGTPVNRASKLCEHIPDAGIYLTKEAYQAYLRCSGGDENYYQMRNRTLRVSTIQKITGTSDIQRENLVFKTKNVPMKVRDYLRMKRIYQMEIAR